MAQLMPLPLTSTSEQAPDYMKRVWVLSSNPCDYFTQLTTLLLAGR